VPITALSRTKGPVGAGTKWTKGDKRGDFTFAHFDQLDPNSFFPDAKLLGIIRFSELMKSISVIVGNTKTFPQIEQAINYKVPDLFSDEVVVALTKGLKAVEIWSNLNGSKWKEIESHFEFFDARGAAGTKITVRGLLPGFSRALDDVHGAMPQFIISSEHPETIVAKEAKDTNAAKEAKDQLNRMNFGRLYEAGQRLLAEIDLVADDPVAPLKASARQLLAELRANVMEALSSSAISDVDELKKAAGSLEIIDTDIERLFSKWFTETAGLQWRQLVLSIPDDSPFVWPPGVPDLGTRILRCFAQEAGIDVSVVTFSSEHWRRIIVWFADNTQFEGHARKCFGQIATDSASPMASPARPS
jgi:hypothetical protein